MATMYCALCRRPVEAKRHIGVGTLILAVVSFGVSLLAIPFYKRRCCICRSAAVSASPPDGGIDGPSAPGQLTELRHRLSATEAELEATGTELERLRTERDFYRQLLEDPTLRRRDRARDAGERPV